MRTSLAAAALAGVLVGVVVIVAAAASQRSFLVPLSGGSYPGWLAGPLAGIGPRLDQTAFEVLVVAMCACYLVAVWLGQLVSPRVVIAVIAAAHIVLLLGPPLLSPDVASYLAYARLGSVYGIDPYQHGPNALPLGDVLHSWIVPDTGPSAYGPTFTLLTYPLAHISVALALWVLKVVAVMASLGLVAIVARCARLRGLAPARAMVLVGLNPVALLYAVGGNHNDLLVMFLLMSGIWLALEERPAQGIVPGILATSLKVSAAPATLFMLLGARHRRRAIMVALITTAVVAVGVLVAFGHGEVFVNYARQLRRAEHLVRRYSVPALVGQLLGLGGMHGVTRGVRIASDALLIGTIIALVVRVRRGADWLTAAGWAQLAALCTTTWLWPWYIVSVLPLAAIARSRPLTVAMLALTAFIVGTQVFLPLG